MKKVSVQYVADTKVKTNLRDDKGKTLHESTITLQPPAKHYKYFDDELQREVQYKAKFLKANNYVCHGVPAAFAEVLNRSRNYKIVAAPKPAPKAKTDEPKVSIKFVQEHMVGRTPFAVGDKKEFKVAYAQKLIDQGKAVLISA